MAYYGYHRISTKEQHLDRGIIEIKRFCENQKIKLESIFTDKITGKNFDRKISGDGFTGGCRYRSRRHIFR